MMTSWNRDNAGLLVKLVKSLFLIFKSLKLLNPALVGSTTKPGADALPEASVEILKFGVVKLLKLLNPAPVGSTTTPGPDVLPGASGVVPM